MFYSCALLLQLCHNLNFGLATTARACKGAGQEGSPKVASCVLKNVGECEGMNPHTPNFGSWSPNGLPNIQRVISGSQTHWIEKKIISLESSWKVDV